MSLISYNNTIDIVHTCMNAPFQVYKYITVKKSYEIRLSTTIQ